MLLADYFFKKNKQTKQMHPILQSLHKWTVFIDNFEGYSVKKKKQSLFT